MKRALCVLLLLSGAAHAQEEMPELDRWLAASEQASASARSAFELIEAYGRGLPVPPPSRRVLINRARTRLDQPLEPQRPRQSRPERLELAEALDELRDFRERIVARLRLLDPEGHPEPEPPQPEPPAPLQLQFYEVQDLVYVPADHVAPSVGLEVPDGGGGGGGGGVLSFDDDYEEYTQGVGIDADKLIELIEKELLSEDERGSVEYAEGRLIVRKTAAALARIEALLERLRRDRGGLVDVEIRVYRMPPEVFREVRAEATALSDEGEARLAAAVAGGRAKLLAGHHVVAHNGQRVHVRRGGSRSFVGDLEVIQSGVVPVISPVVSVLNEGLVVEVRPIVDLARRMTLLDVALSLSKLDEPIEARTIQEVTLELPRMPIARNGSTACVPLGRGALLGGVFKLDAPGDPLTCVVYVRTRLAQGR